MSIFAAATLWSTRAGGGEEFGGGALVVANVDNAKDGGAKIVVGSLEGVLRVFAPRRTEFAPSHLLLEAQLGAPVLQLAVGRLRDVASSGGAISLAVLHPRVLAVYDLAPNGSGDGISLMRVHEHRLGAGGASFTASSMVVGPFGHAELAERSRSGAEAYLTSPQDHVCVQSMDGQLAFYLRGALAFVKKLPNVLLPGPLAYCTAADSFFTCNSGATFECFRFADIGAASDAGARGAAGLGAAAAGAVAQRALQPAWRCVLGERARSITEVHLAAGHARRGERAEGAVAAAQTLMLVVGERALFGFDARLGTLVLHKRLGFEPVAACVYRRSAAMEPADSNLLVASAEGSLSVFHSVQLEWCARLPPRDEASVVVALAVGGFDGVSGLITTLDDGGAISVLYLGTTPPDGAVGSAVAGGSAQLDLDPDAMDAEWRSLLEVIRASKQHSLEADGEGGDGVSAAGPISLRIQVPATLDADAPTGAAEPADEEDARGLPARYRRGSGAESRRVIQATVYAHLVYNSRQRMGDGPLPPYIDVSVSVRAPPCVLLEQRAFTARVATRSGERTTVPLALRCRRAAAPAAPGPLAGSPGGGDVVPSSSAIEIIAIYEETVDAPVRMGVGGSGGARAQLWTARSRATLPLALFATATAPLKLKPLKLTLTSNRPPVALRSLFEELFVQPGLSCTDDAAARLEHAAAAGANVVSFEYYNGAQCTLMGAKAGASKRASSGGRGGAGCRYRLQATRLDALWLVADAFCTRIAEHFAEPGHRVAGEAPFALQYADPLPLVDVFALVDARFAARRALQRLLGGGAPDGSAESERVASGEAGAQGEAEEEESWGELGDRAAQFRLVQKRLLVRYRERTPAALASLDALLADSYHEVLDVAAAAEEKQLELRALTQSLAAAMRLLVLVVRLKCGLGESEVSALRAALEVEVDDAEVRTGGRIDEGGGWEERADIAIAALHQEWFGKTAAAAAPVAGQLVRAAQSTEALKSRVQRLCDKLQRRAARAKRSATATRK